jgi:hypothetical protein
MLERPKLLRFVGVEVDCGNNVGNIGGLDICCLCRIESVEADRIRTDLTWNIMAKNILQSRLDLPANVKIACSRHLINESHRQEEGTE